jgi:hypothetical protein
VRGRQDTDVDAYLELLADRAHGFFLDHPQQLDLHVQRQIGDLIEEQGAAFRRLMSPFLSLTAPVKLPRLWPNSSLSMSSVGMAPQLTGTKGPSRRGPDSWMSFATSSLPVPDSPKICTGAWLRATRAIISRMCCMAAEVPSRRGPNTLVSLSLGSDSLMAVATNLRNPARSKGLETKSKAPSFERAHRGFHVAVGGDHGDRHAGRVLLNPFDQIQAVAVGQLHVGQAQVEPLGLEHALRGRHGIGGARTQVHALQCDRQQLAQDPARRRRPIQRA